MCNRNRKNVCIGVYSTCAYVCMRPYVMRVRACILEIGLCMCVHRNRFNFVCQYCVYCSVSSHNSFFSSSYFTSVAGMYLSFVQMRDTYSVIEFIASHSCPFEFELFYHSHSFNRDWVRVRETLPRCPLWCCFPKATKIKFVRIECYTPDATECYTLARAPSVRACVCLWLVRLLICRKLPILTIDSTLCRRNCEGVERGSHPMLSEFVGEFPRHTVRACGARMCGH